MFQLSAEEATVLRSQSATLETGRGKHPKYRPYAITEQGVAMLSSVLSSPRAIEVNIAIMRAFVRLREILSTHKDLAAKLEKVEKKLGEHDEHFQVVFEAIRQLMSVTVHGLGTGSFFPRPIALVRRNARRHKSCFGKNVPVPVIQAVNGYLMSPPTQAEKKRRIGFLTE